MQVETSSPSMACCVAPALRHHCLYYHSCTLTGHSYTADCYPVDTLLGFHLACSGYSCITHGTLGYSCIINSGSSRCNNHRRPCDHSPLNHTLHLSLYWSRASSLHLTSYGCYSQCCSSSCYSGQSLSSSLHVAHSLHSSGSSIISFSGHHLFSASFLSFH
jgi:hypothetical protein